MEFSSFTSGKFHQVSEDTHWTPFTNVTIQYIRQNFPLPWDEVGIGKLSFQLFSLSVFDSSLNAWKRKHKFIVWYRWQYCWCMSALQPLLHVTPFLLVTGLVWIADHAIWSLALGGREADRVRFGIRLAPSSWHWLAQPWYRPGLHQSYGCGEASLSPFTNASLSLLYSLNLSQLSLHSHTPDRYTYM